MPVITLFGGVFCRNKEIVEILLRRTGYKLIDDAQVIGQASSTSGLPETKIERAFSDKTSVFNKFTNERERSVIYLKLALANMVKQDNLIISGFAGQLLPKTISHVLRVCLIADPSFRTARALEERGLSEGEATKLIRKLDERCAVWTERLFAQNDPWNASIYDAVIPVQNQNAEEAAELILLNAMKEVVQPTSASWKAVEDFVLASEVAAVLANKGHQVEVNAVEGAVTLVVNQYVLMLSRLEEELRSIVEPLPGVKSVQFNVGKGFHRSQIYRKTNFQAPPKVLLVDDEREFAETLSERLIMRDMGPAVVYDGESALSLTQEDDPEIMLLDLKLPGVNGLEVLRRVKETRPEIEVIILTGHGSDADREACMALGAFAYLQKPLDIDLLSQTILQAKEKVSQATEKQA